MVADWNINLKTSYDRRFKGRYNKKIVFYIRHLNRHTSDLPHRDLAIGNLLYRPLSRHTISPLGRRSVYSFVYTPKSYAYQFNVQCFFSLCKRYLFKTWLECALLKNITFWDNFRLVLVTKHCGQCKKTSYRNLRL